ncbi:YybS family protein [Thalassobacillus devorans]|uniref:YybS family protein n=1 Tax=Thalassobacillus devorans TaxID=279813 RepID=UPI00048F234A|nr:YybS family protein [Thalassobacillus devorans]
MMGSKQITDGALMTGVYLIMLLINVFVPFIGILVFFALPVPFIIYSYRHGFKPGAFMLLTAVLLSLLAATIYSLPITLLAGVGGLFTGLSLHKKRSPYETLATGTVGFLLGLVSVFLVTQMLFGVNWIDEINTMLDESFAMTEGMMDNVIGENEATEEQMQALQEQVNQFPDIIPSLFAIMALVLAFISQLLSYKILNRMEQKQLKFAKFRDFKLPTSILWYYFFGMIFTWINSDTESMLYLAAINIFIVTGLLIALQGFAFIFYYTHVKKLSKAIPVFTIILTMLLPTVLLYLVRILGIIDLGFSMRNRLKKDK